MRLIMDQIDQTLEPIFNAQNELELQSLLQAISPDKPVGEPLFDSPVYQTILDARTQEDNSTPRGVWELELQQADWDLVYKESLNAIATQSKDIQLAVWLLEAQINRLGFEAIAPTVYMISQLVKTFKTSFHPQPEGGDMEHRLNIFEWLNSKLTITLKHVAFTQRPDTEHQYNWADWELALHQSQVQNAQPEEVANKKEQNHLEEISQNIHLTPTEYYQTLYSDMELALMAMDDLSGQLDALFGSESPSLANFTGLLEELAGLAYQQLDQRGLLLIKSDTEQSMNEGTEEIHPEQTDYKESQLISSRNDAYIALQSIADFLKVDDPHSPTPYLIYKAIDWGQMNTSQLYSELFVQQQGQLNIFEMLGIDSNHQPATA